MEKSVARALLYTVLAATVGISSPTAAGSPLQMFSIPAHGPFPGITSGPDGALWFTEFWNGRIARITTAGKLLEFPPIQGATNSLDQIINGPDGNLWFSFGQGADVWSASTSGQINPIASQLAEAGPGGIARGPDGAVWVSGGVRQRTTGDPNPFLLRITPGGVRTAFDLPANLFEVGRIAAGPDGALWFTANATANPDDATTVPVVGRMTTDGNVSWYPIPAPSDPGAISDIAGGSDAVWVTYPSADPGGVSYIDRVDAQGHVTGFRIPPAHYSRGGPPEVAAPGEIIRGPDGAMWFSEGTFGGGGALGRITPSGQISHYFLPGIVPVALTVGPDGAIWFTDSINGIGRLSINARPGQISLPTTQRRSPTRGIHRSHHRGSRPRTRRH